MLSVIVLAARARAPAARRAVVANVAWKEETVPGNIIEYLSMLPVSPGIG